jgi:membrane fusion protein (multidrug efflux system)
LENAMGRPTEVITLPETAVTYSLQGERVYIVAQDDRALTVEPRLVKTGASRDG